MPDEKIRVTLQSLLRDDEYLDRSTKFITIRSSIVPFVSFCAIKRWHDFLDYLEKIKAPLR